MRTAATLLLAALAATLIACGKTKDAGQGDQSASGSSTPAEKRPTGDQQPPDEQPAPEEGNTSEAALKDPSKATEQAPDTFKVKLKTSKGDVVIECHRDWSPHGADRFYNLVKIGFYDGCRFFRVIPGFMAQVGMNGDPAIHGKWQSANIPDDTAPPQRQSNLRGYVTFAKTPYPNTRSTQIFINYRNNGGLDRDGFTPFGKVAEGMEVVDSLYGGYGEGAPNGQGPSQGTIAAQGNAYLEKSFPKLDYIEKATIVSE